MRQQGRTSPRTPYSTEYRNRKGFSQTIESLGERVTGVELRAPQPANDSAGQSVEVRLNGVPVGVTEALNFIEGANVTMTVSDDGGVISIEIATTGGGGPPGPTGATGATGGTGATGAAGRDGTRGMDGLDGNDGADGQPGPQGISGAGGADGRMGPPGQDGEDTEDFGLWLPPSAPVSPRFRAQSGGLVPSGALFDTHPRSQAVLENTGPAISGRLSMVALDLPIDTVITSISFLTGATSPTLPTVQLFGMYDSAKNLLRSTVNDGSTAWAAKTIKTLALTSVWRTTYSGLHYLGFLVVCTGGFNLIGTGTFGTILALTPILCFTAESGITTLPNPSTTSPTVSTTFIYAYVS